MIVETKIELFPITERLDAIEQWLNRYCKGNWRWNDPERSYWPRSGDIEFELTRDAIMYKIVWE